MRNSDDSRSSLSPGIMPSVDPHGPLVGISAYSGPARWAIWERTATLLPQVFLDRVAAAGGMPVALPPMPGVEAVVARLDGLVLPGGGDLDPARYGADPHPSTRGVSHGRDAAELALLDAALAGGLPVLGICRGVHLLNVLRGGTLYQNLPDIAGHIGHRPEPGVYGRQPVRLAPGSHLAEILDGDSALVPCHHHQAVDRLGAGLTATAWAEDGTVEAVELADHPFVLAVQWHADQDSDDRLFRALVTAAAGRRQAMAPAPRRT
jgi:gamma-glutamyl-gamma-aminobutyrate hydrolase PuuD